MTVGSTDHLKVASSTRRLVWGLFFYAGWYVLCAVVALGRAAHLLGEWYIPSRGDIYTDSVDVWPGALQPVGRLLLFTAAVGHLVAIPVVVWAAVRLTDPEVRASRVTWRWLLIGTLLVTGTVVLAFSGPGVAVRAWIMD
jgi:hypothetical protein